MIHNITMCIQGVSQNVLNIIRHYSGNQVQKCIIGYICILCKGLEIRMVKGRQKFYSRVILFPIFKKENSIPPALQEK